MQNIITLDMLSAVLENGFSLDELVLAAKAHFYHFQEISGCKKQTQALPY